MGASSLAAMGHIHPLHVQETLVHTTSMAPEPASTSSCRILSDRPCTQPLNGSLLSIRNHLSMHGHKHQRNEVVQCPWAGCPDKLQWMNVPRHIRSIHLGVRMVCPNCERSFTRSLGLAKHVASNKCSHIDDLKARGSDMHDLVLL
ncbi:hypothetical protein EV363DRAFT_1346753 [Boletus edulis]|uniref:C2H2-type domain-containing protein n=1 Tax=Boletus edulis BED1 TaxID=1328754 RepID=A0AAD4BV68_BOLED|nr:hypothetical protein EV363DRAFT_1346753 [Boletus edulis]KAF8440474.1 hypothetical protein L210DRAFT_3539766 [Boletus edulis BED1]